MDRKEFLFNWFKEACLSSSIYYNKEWPSIKLNICTGEVFLIGRNRHLDIIKHVVPDWNPKTDYKYIEIIDDGVNFKTCEAGRIEGTNYYYYTISFIGDN